MKTKTAEIIVASLLMGIGALVAFDSLRLGSGWGMEGPRPGFFPFLMSILVVGGSILIIRQAVTGTSSAKGEKRFVLAGGMKPVFTVFFPAMGMVIGTEIVGLYVAAMIYLAAYIKWVGGFRWATVLLISIPIPLVCYVLFDKIFLIPMPMGMFGSQILRF